MANKREYAAANKRWLEEKSQEEGVKALPKGIYYKKYWQKERTMAFTPLQEAL